MTLDRANLRYRLACADRGEAAVEIGESNDTRPER